MITIDISLPEVRDNVFWGALLLAFLYYSISSADTNRLLATIVVGGLAWVGYAYLAEMSASLEGTQANKQGALDGEAKRMAGRLSTGLHGDQAWVPKFPKKGFKYLVSNPDLITIATDMGVLRIFDRPRFADLCNLMNTYQKTYEYILSDRYDAEAYLTTFQDAGDAVLEVLYSTVFVFPDRFKHVYGVNPDGLVQANVTKFIVLRRKMTEILNSYAMKERGVKVVPLALPKAAHTAHPCLNKTMS